jgi:hypothetical protein
VIFSWELAAIVGGDFTHQLPQFCHAVVSAAPYREPSI